MTATIEHPATPDIVEWRESYRTGVAEVDQEHQRLFALVHALDLDTVQQAVDDLLDYVVTHFTNEQDLMEKSGYPAFEQHLKLHEEFAGQVAAFLQGDVQWTDDRVQELRHFLNKWLSGHIMTHDLRFGTWHAAQLAHGGSAQLATTRPSGFFARLFGSRLHGGADRSAHP